MAWSNKSDPNALRRLQELAREERENKGNSSVSIRKDNPTSTKKNDTATATKEKTETKTETRRNRTSPIASKSDPAALQRLQELAKVERETYKARTTPTRSSPATPPTTYTAQDKKTSFATETKNAYTKYASNQNTTIASNMTEEERKARIKEINNELNALNTKISGYSGAKVYDTNKALEEAEKKDKERISELSQELKTLERVGTFSASELKQFEIDDAKKKVSAMRNKVQSYGQSPSANDAEAYRQANSELFKAQEELDELERQKSLYDDIAEFGDVVNNDDFWGQWRANYRSTDIFEKKSKAFSEYMGNPTDENREIAMAYEAFAQEYLKNNEKALDDEGQSLPLLSKNFSSYLAQKKGEAGIAIPLGAIGATLGGLATGGAGVKAGWTTGYSLGAGINSYSVIRGSVFSELISYGLDEETAYKMANDDALIEAIIESVETAKDWIFMLYGGGAGKATGVASKATNKAAKAATKAAAHPVLNFGLNVGKGMGLNAMSEYAEEGLQGAVSRATREKALSILASEVGQYGKGNIDLNNRPIYKNEDGTISTVDSITVQIDDKYVLLPSIIRDESGNPKRLEETDDIVAHYVKTGEHLGEFATLEEANAYAEKLHHAQAYTYSNNTTVDADDNILVGSAKVVGDALFGGNTEALQELHAQGMEGAKTSIVGGGIQGTVRTIVSAYATARTVQEQNKVVDAALKDEESLNALIEEGKASGEGTVSHKIATEIETAREKGEDVTREQVRQLIASNDVYIAEEEKTTEPDTLEKAAMDVVASRNAPETAKTEPILNVPVADDSLPTQEGKSFKTYRMNSVLGNTERSIGTAGGQAFVTNSKDINPSPTNRSVFLPVNDTEVAKTEFGANESNKTSENISKILASDFVPVRKTSVDGTLEGVGEVRVYTDENGREIALETNVAEYFDGYNLEATFRGGKPYAIKATDNEGNVAGVAMAVWQDSSGQKYNVTDVKTAEKSNVPYNVMSNENPMLQERKAREAYIKNATGYGDYGVRAFADIMETISESEAPIVARAFQTAYEAGLTNVETSKVNLPTELQRIAFNAGKQDFIMENVGKVENVKNVKSHGDNAGLDSTNVPSSVSKQAIDIADRFCKELGVKAWMTGDSDMYNAHLTDNVGVVQIASDFSVLEDLGEDATSLSFVLHALHEIAGHRAEELAPIEYAEFKREMYNYKNSVGGSLANAKRQKYGNKGVDISLSEAMGEVANNSILEIYDNDLNLLKEGLDRVLNGTNVKAKQGANIFKQALDYVIKKFNQLLEKLGVKTKKTYEPSVNELIKVRDAFEQMLGVAIAKNKEIAKTSNLVTEKNGTIFDANGNVVAQINEDGTASFSLKTFDDTGRAELKKWLDKNVKNKKLTEADAKDISEQLEYYYDICKEYEDKYAPFSAWSKAEVVKGLDGKPLMSVVKANGDYKMNLDFSLVCKKRRPLDALYRAMIDDGFMDNIGQLSEIEVARINEIIRKNGFETACTLCFVDSKRYRQYAVADSFVSKYNELVKMLAPEGAKIDRFDFSGKREASADGLHTMSNEELKKGINKLNKVIKEHGETTVVGKIAKHLKAVPKDRKLVMVSDFMDSEGFVRVKKANPNVFKLYNSSKGSGGPKATLPDVQYLGEILKKSNFTPKNAYAVGGVRVQSFSDYIPRLVFDYLQMTADLTAKKLPAHAYSKEDIFVMQFGKTGIKINMSLVPAVAEGGIAPGLDKNGNYVWVDGHTFASDFHDKGSGQRGFELAVKIQNTEGYAQNCGTIAVGVSDEHIIKMLKDNDIRMVIPYHKSSLNHFVAKMGNIDQYKDYTNVQNTRDRATGKKIEGKDFNFNEAFHRLGDAKAATNEYLAWCEKNNYIPKFDTFAFHEDAEVRENYYKVLIDFAAYDSDGNPTPQGAVTMNFPTENDAFGSMKELIEKGLEADAILEGRKTENIPKILKEVKSVLGKETEGKKYSLKEGETAEGLDGGKKYSLKVKDQKIIDFLENQEHITTYKAMQLIDGKLYPPMAAKTKGTDGKYYLTNPSELGAWQRAVEDTSNIKFNDKGVGYYVLNKGDGSSVTAAYNPYEHSSNLVLNDQFEGAYKRDNLVTVECVIPKSEMTSKYKARHAKDTTGVLDWKSGVVAGKIKDNKRKVYLSRWLKPVRILTDAETAKMYKDALGNSDVSVPFNVVTPSLLSELEKIGVPIDREGSPMYKSNQERNKAKGKKYSLKDSEYLELAKNPEKNEARLNAMVCEAAKEAGYTERVYHGTTGFGFTKVNVRKSDDGISFFATDSLDLAQTYSGVSGLTPIKGNKYSAENKQKYDTLVSSFVDKINEIAGKELLKINELPFDNYLNKIKKGIMNIGQLSIEMTNYTFDVIEKLENDKRLSVEEDKSIWDMSTELETALYGMNGKSGNYGLYADTDGFFEVDGKGANWSSIPFDKIPSKTTANTREIVKWAKENGYTGVLFKNIYDIGTHVKTQKTPANVYAFLNPQEQVKSADPITYNTFGKVIPLSKRFNKQNNDIRYSLKDSEGNTLTEAQTEFFKDSKVRDENGNLLVVYHGSPAKFTVFDHYHINKRGNSHGRGFYFTEKKSLAEGYEKDGGQLLKGYLNITKPLSEDKKTMKKADLLKLIKATCEAEARMIVEDGGYDNVREALRDTWISNCVNTYEMSMDSAYREVLNIFWNGNDNDVELISDLTNSGAGNENTLRQVHNVLGYDGVIYTAPDGTHEFVSLVSEQFKSIDNATPTSNPDINFSLKGTERDISLRDVPNVRKAVIDKRADVLAKYVDSGAISTEVYNQLIEEFGAIPTGEKPFRDVQVPQKTAKNKKVSQTVRTILEAEATPDEAVPTIEKMVEDGIFSYDAYSDKQAIENGEDYIKEHGWEQSLVDWFEAVNSGEVSKDITTTGWILYNHAANSGDAKTAIMILDAMVRHQRSAAQALQATRILKKLSPEAQLYGVQKSVEAFQRELTEKYGDKAPDLKIDEDLAEQFMNAKTEEERTKVEKEIYKDIGRQMPSRFMDKWNAWRYLAMLGNPRTHIRNIGGNAFFAPIVATKNLTATAIESVVYRVSRKKMVRGKSLITGNKADRALLKAAWADYGTVADMISNGGKYNDSALANQSIEDGRKIFKGIFTPIEWARKGNSKLLEAEDMWFARPHYAFALAQYCKANNITAEQIKNGKAIAPAREYAIKEAQKATYRDTNAFSQMVSEWGRSNKNEKNIAKKAFNTVIEGILPFRKTPANILVRGIEYSPIGLLKGLSYDLVQVGKGNMSASQAIDNISAGLTGTGLLALGIYLAAQGLVRGHGEDEKEEKEFNELMGRQAYALELPNGQSITLDWLAPEALPFFVGVNIWETTSGTDEEVNLSSILKAVTGITEPMLEMSCLQSLNDIFESVGYASSNDTSGLISVVSSAATSYLTQAFPTLLGQAERTGEEERMTTYTEKSDFLTGDMQYTLGKVSAKIPFWDYHQIPYIDAWGRREASGTALKRGLNNFLNPAYTSTIEESAMEKELLRLYESTGETKVFPSRADKYFTVDKARKDLTADEYVRYATLKGEKSYKLVSDLVNSKAYKKLDDGEKVKAISEAYDYANQKAKQAVSNYKGDSWVATADEFGKGVGNYLAFRADYNDTKSDNGGKIEKTEVIDIIMDMAQNDNEVWLMYLDKYDNENAQNVRDKGIEGEAYLNFLDALDEVDEPTKSGKYGSYTQDEAKKAVNRVDGLTRKEKSILWQSVNSSWKNNPF